MLLDSHNTVDMLGGFEDLRRSYTQQTAEFEDDIAPTRHADSTSTSSQDQKQNKQPAFDSTNWSSHDVESHMPELNATKIDHQPKPEGLRNFNKAGTPSMLFNMEKEDSYTYQMDWSQREYIGEINKSEVDWSEVLHNLWEEEDVHVNASRREETDSVISYGDPLEREEEESKEENGQKGVSCCNKIDEDAPEPYKEEDFTLEEEQDKFVEPYHEDKAWCEEIKSHGDNSWNLEAETKEGLGVVSEREKENIEKPFEDPCEDGLNFGEQESLIEETLEGDEEEEQSEDEIDKEFEQLMNSPIDEDLVIRYEEEEQSAEEIDNEFERLMGYPIDENLVICYAQGDDQEGENHKTIMRHSTDLFKDIEEPEPPMQQLLNNHIFILPNTPTSSHLPGKTYFGKIRITEFKAWLYDAPRKILFEEIRLKTFKGWFYDEYDPGDPSSNLTST